jgi:hypothetical protein
MPACFWHEIHIVHHPSAAGGHLPQALAQKPCIHLMPHLPHPRCWAQLKSPGWGSVSAALLRTGSCGCSILYQGFHNRATQRHRSHGPPGASRVGGASRASAARACPVGGRPSWKITWLMLKKRAWNNLTAGMHARAAPSAAGAAERTPRAEPKHQGQAGLRQMVKWLGG